jgi:hypothetical protein
MSACGESTKMSGKSSKNSEKGIRLDILTFSSSLKLSARSLAQLSQLK